MSSSASSTPRPSFTTRARLSCTSPSVCSCSPYTLPGCARLRACA
jgi:hypothetical protein